MKTPTVVLLVVGGISAVVLVGVGLFVGLVFYANYETGVRQNDSKSIAIKVSPCRTVGECEQEQWTRDFQAALEMPVVRTTADELVAAYEANAVAADLKFKSRIVEVSGVVKNFDSWSGEPHVLLGAREFGSVRCRFRAGEEPLIASMQKGSRVMLRGLLVATYAGQPLIVRCSVSKS